MVDRLDVLLVSLGATGGLRAVDDELLASLQRAGVSAAIVRPEPPSPVRTLMLTDLCWARATRSVLQAELARREARALIYSTTTSALLWPRAGAIRFDASAVGNRPGRHGLWQRPLERRRLREAPLLLPQSAEALQEAGSVADPRRALVLPAPVEPSGQQPVRDVAAITYAANPVKKGLDRILRAWRAASRPGEELLVAGASESELRGHGYALPATGVRVLGTLSREDYRALLRRARVFMCAARREDYGIAQLEALADGCMLVTTPSPGPYVALPIARRLDPRLVGEDLAGALRAALDEPRPGYAEHALSALEPFRRAEVDRLVLERLLPRLLA
ncbi:MAG TPA: glycosyltransferase [Solirubrobacteraceae bacterium]|nr:glycosyltransferase [Solirubrobacteraceae bacterium]